MAGQAYRFSFSIPLCLVHYAALLVFISDGEGKSIEFNKCSPYTLKTPTNEVGFTYLKALHRTNIPELCMYTIYYASNSRYIHNSSRLMHFQSFQVGKSYFICFAFLRVQFLGPCSPIGLNYCVLFLLMVRGGG